MLSVFVVVLLVGVVVCGVLVVVLPFLPLCLVLLLSLLGCCAVLVAVVVSWLLVLFWGCGAVAVFAGVIVSVALGGFCPPVGCTGNDP